MPETWTLAAAIFVPKLILLGALVVYTWRLRAEVRRGRDK